MTGTFIFSKLLPHAVNARSPRLLLTGSMVATAPWAVLLIFLAAAGSSAQTAAGGQPASLPDAPHTQMQSADAVTLRSTPVNILKDQAVIWTSPIRVRSRDLVWLAPLAIATGAAIATDHHAMASVVSHDPSFNDTNVNASNVLIGGFIAAPVVLFGAGEFRGHPHAREAGILGAEAIVDGVVVEQGMKFIFWRERPASHNARGSFFQSGTGVDSSFPSSHAVLGWASAAVIAGEYPSHWAQLGVYSLAAGVSVTRVLGQQHFPTDVLVGSAAGWLIGHYVYRTRHRQ